MARFSRVLVTGGGGCIGLPVCRDLVARGLTPHLLDLHEQVDRVQDDIGDGVEVFAGSILDNSSLRDAIRGCDAVIHLAAYLGVRRTEQNRLRCVEINIKGTQNILECAIQENVGKVVLASSSEVYGEPAENPVSEDTPTQGKSVYAVTKMAGEELVKAYQQRYPNLHYTILRFFNTFGPHQVAQFVIPRFLRNAMNGRPPVVYGDGQQRRAYCYSTDTARATVDALLAEVTDDDVLNIGNSENRVTLAELAQLAINVTGRQGELEVEYQGDFDKTDRTKEREVYQRFCNTSKAKELLGFGPRISLEQGMRNVVEHGPIPARWPTTDVDYMLDD